MCGKLPYTYEHIVDYKICRDHQVDNLVLLCANCHLSVTAKRTSKDTVRDWQKRPYSIRNNFANYSFFHVPLQYLKLAGQYFNIHEGQTIYVVALHSGTVLSVRLEDGVPLFSALLSDFTGNPSIKIVDNEIVVKSNHLWDVSLSGKVFRARFGSRRIFLDMLVSEGVLTIRKLFAYLDGFAVKVTSDELQFKILPKSLGVLAGNIMVFPPGEDFNIVAAEGVARRSFQRLPEERGYVTSAEAQDWFWDSKP